MYSHTQLFLIYAGVFFAAVVFALLINSLFLRFARTLGIREDDALVRWSSSAKPAFGGIGFIIIFLGAFAVYGIIFPIHSATLQPELLGLLGATGLAFLMGLADDAYNTQPVLKFFVQMLCGAILITTGSSIEFFSAGWLNVALTMLWVVGLMNSINMLDNMDAIASAVSLCILGCALIVQFYLGRTEQVLTLLILGTMAALAGFLFFNWHPSRMFMGDTGSQFLGVFLAYVGIQCFWRSPSPDGDIDHWRQASSALIVFLLPIIDTTVVTINRIGRGRSPFIGGRDHTTHHLSYAGFSDAQVALAFIGLGALSVFLTFVVMQFIPTWRNMHTLVCVGYGLSLFGLLFGISRRTKPHPGT